MLLHRLSFLLVFLLLFLTTGACASSAPRSDWVPLGERVVNHRAERDEIRVTVREGTFRRVKLRVMRHAVTFRTLRIHFANGDVQNVTVRSTIKAGGETRAIDLRGGERVIEKVVFVYRTSAPRGRRAVVQLYGVR